MVVRSPSEKEMPPVRGRLRVNRSADGSALMSDLLKMISDAETQKKERLC